jgi:ABC-type transport system involved in multi-copper enzyme maturation permease subunit
MIDNQLKINLNVPGTWKQCQIIAKYELLNYIKSRRFLILSLIMIAAGIITTVVVGYLHPISMLVNQANFYIDWYGNTIRFVLILPVILFGGDSISGEFQNKTGYSMFGNPISRFSLFLGKWISGWVASILIFSIFALITLGNGIFYFNSLPVEFLYSYLQSVLFLAAALSVVVLISALFKNIAISILFSAGALLIGFTIAEEIIIKLWNIIPWFSLNYASYGIMMIFSITTSDWFSIFVDCAVMVFYTIICAVISYIIFRYRDLT